MLEEMEKEGKIQIMKALSGSFKDGVLPPLGGQNVHGLGINDLGNSGYQRFRSVWWDDAVERGRAGKRLDQGTCFELLLGACIPSTSEFAGSRLICRIYLHVGQGRYQAGR